MYSAVGFNVPATSAVGGGAATVVLHESGLSASYPWLDVAILVVAAFTLFYAVLALRNLAPVRRTAPSANVPTRTRPAHRPARKALHRA